MRSCNKVVNFPSEAWYLKKQKQHHQGLSWLATKISMHSDTAAAKSLQSCPTLCDPIDGSPPGSTVPGILQARTLEWVAISSSNAWKWKVKVKSLSCVQLSATLWTAAYQAPPSMGFSRQEYWSGVPLPSLTQILNLTLNSSISYKTQLLLRGEKRESIIFF